MFGPDWLQLLGHGSNVDIHKWISEYAGSGLELPEVRAGIPLHDVLLRCPTGVRSRTCQAACTSQVSNHDHSCPAASTVAISSGEICVPQAPPEQHANIPDFLLSQEPDDRGER